jgi:protein ImuA
MYTFIQYSSLEIQRLAMSLFGTQPMSQTPPLEIIQELKERLRQTERAHRQVRDPVFPTETALDQLLPDQGLEWGRLVEWLSDGEGTGVVTLALTVAARLMRRGGVLVVIDGKREFYPPAAAGLGISLEHTVIVQPANDRDALWALEQSLRSSSVAVVLAWLGKLNDLTFRRLQLAAEAGGSIGMLLRPGHCRKQPSWAAVRLLVNALPTLPSSSGRRVHVELLYCRAAVSGGMVEVELRQGDTRQKT